MRKSFKRLQNNLEETMNSLLASRGIISDSLTTTTPPGAVQLDDERRSFFVRGAHQRAAETGGIPFYNILARWITVAENEDEESHREILSKVPLLERQLLNLKVNDPCFIPGSIKPTVYKEVKAGLEDEEVPNTESASPDWGNEFFLSSAPTAVNSQNWHTYDPKISQQFPGQFFNCFSIAHFAAELGDIDWMKEIASTYSYTSTGIPYFSAHHIKYNSVPEKYPTFNLLATSGFDFNGCLPCHLAAGSGNVPILSFLMEQFTAETVLNAQKGRSVRSSLWGSEVHRHDLNTIGCAICESQINVLEFLYSNHRNFIRSLKGEQIDCALTSCTLNDDNTDCFDFLLRKNIITPPLDDESPVSALLRNNCGGSFGAASEAGHINILLWMAEVFGDEILISPGKEGATALHHCARGCNAPVLRKLLERESVRQYVDAPDDRGRTPALWCIMSRHRSGKVVDTLKVLREAGSEWRSTQDRNGNSIIEVASRYVSPFSKVMRYLKKNI
ncbi:hypothetical protein ADEAN_000878100 [Angomonas deanei]|uniref:Uncharacterized protein n=1 Tax=Angomonas deanei TaxID=59799 RepID=A0A7G2CN26_9TRYP|nr:hypothetical protein ADEAN_000878100 [Angomonas deanei]